MFFLCFCLVFELSKDGSCSMIPTVPLPNPVWFLQGCACNHPENACVWGSASSCHENAQLLFVPLPADEEVPPGLTREKDINISWVILTFFFGYLMTYKQ